MIPDIPRKEWKDTKIYGRQSIYIAKVQDKVYYIVEDIHYGHIIVPYIKVMPLLIASFAGLPVSDKRIECFHSLHRDGTIWQGKKFVQFLKDDMGVWLYIEQAVDKWNYWGLLPSSEETFNKLRAAVEKLNKKGEL